MSICKEINGLADKLVNNAGKIEDAMYVAKEALEESNKMLKPLVDDEEDEAAPNGELGDGASEEQTAATPEGTAAEAAVDDSQMGGTL